MENIAPATVQLRNNINNKGDLHMSWLVTDNQVVVFERRHDSFDQPLSNVMNRHEYFESIKNVEWIKVRSPYVKEPPAKTMFNSHGEWAPLSEIYQIEVEERGNSTFDNVDPAWVAQHSDCLAIWATMKPVAALRYAIGASEWEEEDEVLEARYPNYRDEMITAVDTDGCIQLGEEDGDDGYLLVFIKGNEVQA